MTERKGFQSTLDTQVQRAPRATLEMKRSNLAPKVRSYADNLAVQIRDILAAHNITSIAEFNEQARRKNSPLLADLTQLEHLVERLNQIREKGELPPEALLVISVESGTKDIQNPFADIWTENSITGKEKLEKFEIDLGEMLELQKATYRAKCLDTWADALPTNASDIISSDPKKLERFKDYLKEGRIPVFMPPASVQLATMKSMVSGERFSHFKPDITSTDANGTPSTTEAEDGYIAWDHFINLMASENQTLVSGVPEHWYIMWEKPTAKPEAINKNLAKQEQHIRQAQEDFKKKYATQKPLIGGIMPAEYLAFQTLLPVIAKEYLKKMEGKDLVSYTPIDKGIFIRFLGVKKSDNGDVAAAKWGAVGRGLRLGGGGMDAYQVDGVRLPVREEV